ncbi:PTS lactose transporter subunit IIC [Erysipelatoclostridium sp. An15]|uniref:PTS sugar transporter subunit IIC n=2 Tax=unclassified Thomasclavelia TaxID=3025756 RepID=UPI000B385D39|nr:PTS transporter subunit EIIC [Erysipelatoclostridium sp. An15]OUQ09018.1 PTS lactose transporter subunit IIC [Erysipelatoclostridium sp. An15]WRK53327.1 PTS transporter subunit EIIC [Coprobacillaceae bacterium CR2/5/TPMF4]
MDKMADVLGRVGAWCGQNKYLSAIKNAFQTFMPLTIAGAIGVLWCNVLVNADSGLGMFWEPIMALDFINPAFSAIQFATISCITVGITFGIAQEIGESNGETGYFAGLLGLACWLAVTQNSFGNYALVEGADKAAKVVLNDSGAMTVFAGLSGNTLGATGLFTGMIIGVVSVEIFCALRKVDKLKLKMPESVPPGVARAFEVLIPACITLIIIAVIGRLAELATGQYLNDLISTYIQGPLGSIGATVPGVIVIYLLIMLFWLVGIHGNNMLSAVKEALFTPIMLENIETFSKTNDAYSDELGIFAMAWLQMFGEFGGSGVTIGLVISILVFGKREDNRTIAGISSVPALFNINETVTFGIPMVLNPILGIPFVLAPIATIVVGYILTVIGFCPKAVINTPWTTPPILHGFLTTGANVMGAVSQAIALVVSIVIYAPFLIAYERFQNKQAAE